MNSSFAIEELKYGSKKWVESRKEKAKVEAKYSTPPNEPIPHMTHQKACSQAKFGWREYCHSPVARKPREAEDGVRITVERCVVVAEEEEGLAPGQATAEATPNACSCAAVLMEESLDDVEDVLAADAYDFSSLGASLARNAYLYV